MIKIIHQIWIGEETPQKYAKLMQTVRENNPDWEYKLWRENDIPDSFKSKNIKRLITKVDVLRFEILYNYGGIYIDADTECTGSINTLVKDKILFTALYYPSMIPEIALAGVAEPNHPALREYLDTVAYAQLDNETIGPVKYTGNYFVKDIFLKYPDYSGIRRNSVLRHKNFASWVKDGKKIRMPDIDNIIAIARRTKKIK